ncbi:hypothetical protein EYF80_031539 [Liparis tanakae]|uniref:Uncharacterized protein n=1 Tax=Liparis tanakae TaxID=230148 RepID=A0A4Z2GX60_9TELE|nr:hypothetical protein EYF80_031539 [Liparis tanakae]
MCSIYLEKRSSDLLHTWCANTGDPLECFAGAICWRIIRGDKPKQISTRDTTEEFKIQERSDRSCPRDASSGEGNGKRETDVVETRETMWD